MPCLPAEGFLFPKAGGKSQEIHFYVSFFCVIFNRFWR